MGNINTTKLSTVLLDTAPSRCVLGAKLLTNGPRCRSASCISTGISPCIDYRGKQTKQRGLLSGFNKYSSRAMESCRNIMQNINSSMINTEFHTSTRLARSLVAFAEERLKEPKGKIRPLQCGPYTITKPVGKNTFELNLPPFLGLYPVFNVELL